MADITEAVCTFRPHLSVDSFYEALTLAEERVAFLQQGMKISMAHGAGPSTLVEELRTLWATHVLCERVELLSIVPLPETVSRNLHPIDLYEVLTAPPEILLRALVDTLNELGAFDAAD